MSGVLFSYSPVALPELNSNDLQIQLLWGHILPVQVLRALVLDVVPKPLPP